MDQQNNHTKIINNILRTKKYANLSVNTVSRIVDWAGQRYKPKEIEKKARKKIHQIYSAYFNQSDIAAFKKILEDTSEINKKNDKDFFLKILKLHSSSNERISDLNNFYKNIFAITDVPNRVVDFACGLNPFSFPWLREHGDNIEYTGFDIDINATEIMDNYFSKIGYPVSVGFNDLFLSIPTHGPSDVVMLLKALPCLEQQEKGICKKILQNIQSQFIVLSFPSKSLSGKSKGMVENYQQFLFSIIDEPLFEIHKIPFSRETVYVLKKI